jgi:hypothetical protein
LDSSDKDVLGQEEGGVEGKGGCTVRQKHRRP